MAVIINGTTGITAPGTEAFGDGTALGGATNPIVSMAKGANNYVQSYIVNNTAGVSSSADVVAYADNSTDSHGWVDMGFTSSAYADTTYTVTGPNEAYLFGSAPSGSGKTGNLVIATDNTGTANSIQFYTNGFTQAKSAAKMTIDGLTGNILVGTTSAPTNKGLVNIASNKTYQVGGTSVSALAWVNFNGTSASPITPRANYNVGSITKNATGDYTLNFTNALTDANYSAVASGSPAYGAANTLGVQLFTDASITESAPTTSAMRIKTSNTGGTAIDVKYVCVAIFGN
jgi:hypothetical protein